MVARFTFPLARQRKNNTPCGCCSFVRTILKDSNAALRKTFGECFLAVTEGFCKAHLQFSLCCPCKIQERIPPSAPNKKQQIDTIVSTYCFLFIVKKQSKVLVNQVLFYFCGAFRYLRYLYPVLRILKNAEKHYSPSRCSAFLSLKDWYSLDYKSCGYNTIFPLYDPIPPMS